jgi:3-deoxy-D-arabino-heptulosonate 7-phosphate (DAHP) synthase
MRELEIIAGPCSVDHKNIEEIREIADMGTISGVRVVGLKSRTDLDPTGKGMGIDFDAYQERKKKLKQGISATDIVPPSVKYAADLANNYGVQVATEVMNPHVQVPAYIGRIPENKLLLWQPSVMQLGWPVEDLAEYAEENGWAVGIKNGKALGSTLAEANDPDTTETSMEKAWKGLAAYANKGQEIILIHRGVDVPEKGDYRNALVHEAARRVKAATGRPVFHDPSHSLGDKMRPQIVEDTIKTMHMKDGSEFLYDGILIETGTSQTDTNQHISLDELSYLTKELSTFRDLRTPEKTIFKSYARR